MKVQIDNSVETSDFIPLEFDEAELLESRRSGIEDDSSSVRRSIEKRREERRLQKLISDYDDFDDGE